ncbi:MAG TPA: hypothetical protein VH496_08340 [Mycobacterium sp.]|jgi:hypothetical protein
MLRRNDMTDVFLTPEGGHDVAELCVRTAARLTEHTATVVALADGLYDGWLGDCEEGRGWARLLQEKSAGANSLRWLLARHVTNLNEIAAQFRSTTQVYGETDNNVLGRQWPE